MRTGKEIKEIVKEALVVGKKYRINMCCIRDGRSSREEKVHDCVQDMYCVGIYKNFARFENRRGMSECFLFTDLYKMLFD